MNDVNYYIWFEDGLYGKNHIYRLTVCANLVAANIGSNLIISFVNNLNTIDPSNPTSGPERIYFLSLFQYGTFVVGSVSDY